MGNALRVVAANDEHAAAAHRWARVLLSATVRNAFGDHNVTIREVSSKGAVVQASMIPPAGSRLLLMRGPIMVMGTVAWTGEGTYCLEFHDSIDHEQLLISIPSAKKLDQPLKALFPSSELVPGTIAKH